jgi:mannose-P-dolichol utilization defect protein 1
MQAVLNFKNSSTGALSAITLVLQFAGCVARIFTSIQETGDMSLIVNYVLLSILNGIICGQLVYYWNNDINKKSKKE